MFFTNLRITQLILFLLFSFSIILPCHARSARGISHPKTRVQTQAQRRTQFVSQPQHRAIQKLPSQKQRYTSTAQQRLSVSAQKRPERAQNTNTRQIQRLTRQIQSFAASSRALPRQTVLRRPSTPPVAVRTQSNLRQATKTSTQLIQRQPNLLANMLSKSEEKKPLIVEIEKKVDLERKADLENLRIAEERKTAEFERQRLAAEQQRQVELEKQRLATEQQRQVELEKQRLATEQQRQVELEKQRVAEEKRQAELEKQRVAEEQRQAELEKQRVAEEQRKAELEKQRVAEEQRKAELEKQRVAEEQRKSELEKQRVAEEQRKAVLEKQRVAEEQRKAELEKQRVAEEQRKSELEKQRVAEEQKKAEFEKQRVAEEQRQAELEKQRVAEEQRKAQLEKQRVAEEQRKAQLEKQRVAEQQKKAELEKQRVAEQQKKAELEKQRVAEEQRKAQLEKQRVAEQQKKAQLEQQRIAEEQRQAELNKQRLARENERSDRARKAIDQIPLVNYTNYHSLGLHKLFNRGYCGQGTTIAVIETGFHYTVAPEARQAATYIPTNATSVGWHTLYGKHVLAPLKFYNLYNAPDSEVVQNGGKAKTFAHGDRVASLLAHASPYAKILPVTASLGANDSFSDALEALADRNDVDIINISRSLEGSDTTHVKPKIVEALRKCANKGKIMVLSAGNDNIIVPDKPTSACARVNWLSDLLSQLSPTDTLRKHMVLSGALQHLNDNIADYSVKAGTGSLQQHYIATTGTTYDHLFSEYWSGTSVSAPYTTAILSNLLSGRKSKSATEAVKMLYETAEVTSQPQVFGKGLVRGQHICDRLERDEL
jgi:hypothetical protein